MRKVVKFLSISLQVVLLTSCFGGSSSKGSSKTEDKTEYDIKVYRDSTLDHNIIFVNDLVNYKVEVRDKAGNLITDKNSMVEWGSDDRYIASPDSFGHITGNSNGKTRIKAQYGMSVGYCEVEVKTKAKTFELKEERLILPYREGTFEVVPIEMDKDTVSVDYTFSTPNIVKTKTYKLSDNYFEIMGAGDVNVHAEAYISYTETKSLDFTMHCISDLSPYFYHRNVTNRTFEANVPKNKYKTWTLDVFTTKYPLPLTAISYDGERDLTDSITVIESDYDGTKVGEYKVLLEATDELLNTKNRCLVYVTVEEYERQEVQSPIDAIDYKNYTYKFIKNDSNRYDKIQFDVDVSLNTKYGDASGEVRCFFSFKVKALTTSTIYDHTSGDTQIVTVDMTKRNEHITWVYEGKGSLDPDSLQDNGPNIVFSGWCYIFKYYS